MKTIAVTFTHDYSTYLQKWVKYYSAQVDDLQIINIGDRLKIDWGANASVMNQIQPALLRDYDLIVFTDVDEYLVPDPAIYKSLKEYLELVKAPVMRCTGYNIMEMPGDKRLNHNKPVLSQRTHWQQDNLYSKYVIVKEPQKYRNPHHIENEQISDKRLKMLHLRDCDTVSMAKRAKGMGRRMSTEQFGERRKQAVEIPKKWIKIGIGNGI